MSNPKTQAKQLRGKHVLFGLLSFFAVIFIVNGIFLSKAISSFPGEITKKSYIQGINYNDTIELRRTQQELGWTAEVGIANLQTGNALLVRLFDEGNIPLNGLSVMALLSQHSNEHTTLEAQLEPLGGGEYSIAVDELEKGRWTCRILVSSDDGASFEVKKEIIRK